MIDRISNGIESKVDLYKTYAPHAGAPAVNKVNTSKS